MKRILLAALSLLCLATVANAQCTGNPASGRVCGNSSASSGPAGFQTLTSMFDRVFGTTEAPVLQRRGGVWTTSSGTGAITGLFATADDTTASSANVITRANSSDLTLTSHAAARTVSRYGITLGGWTEIKTTNNTGTTNGLIIGTQTNTPIVFGTNNLERMRVNGDGTVRISDLASASGFECIYANTTGVTSNAACLQSFASYGGVSGGSTATNDAAVTAVQAVAGRRIYVPYGTFATGLDAYSTTAFSRIYWGDGQLTTNSGEKRGLIFAPINRPSTRRSAPGSLDLWNSGDLDQVPFWGEVLINSPLVQTGSLVTSAGSLAGSTTLTFASVPSWVGYGTPVGGGIAGELEVANTTTPTSITAGTVVTAVTATTVTISPAVAGPGVGAGDTITFGLGQYFQPPEGSWMNVNIRSKSGTLNASQIPAGNHGQNFTGFNVYMIHDAGGGGIGGFFCGGQNDRAYAGFGVGNPYNTSVIGCYAGNLIAQADHVYLNPAEWRCGDNGHPVMCFGLVLDHTRTAAPTLASDVWGSLNMNAGDSTQPLDWILGGAGLFNYGLNLTPFTFTNTGLGPTAIVLKAGQYIALNGVAGAFGPSSRGTEGIHWDAGASAVRTTIGGNVTVNVSATSTTYAGATYLNVINDTSGTGFAGFALQDAGVTAWNITKDAGNDFVIGDAVTPRNVFRATTAGAVTFTVTSLVANGNTATTGTRTVRASGGAADCTLVFTVGILTGGTC